MAFFNKKEDVLDVKLTKFGREQYMRGKLKPKYYSFMDKDIIYDSNNPVEGQNDIVERIKTTPKLKVQVSTEGVDKGSVNSVGDENYKLQGNKEKLWDNVMAIGTADQMSFDKNPAWDLKLWKGTISGSINYLTQSELPSQRVPEIGVDLIYKTYGVKEDTLSEEEVYEQQIKYLDEDIFPSYEDGTTIQIINDFLIIDIKEQNAPYEGENFDIEMFYEHSDTKELVPMYFTKEQQEVVNGILVDEIEEKTYDIIDDLNQQFVDYYFDIEVDEDIDVEVFCKNVEEDKAEDYILGTTFNCKDRKKVGKRTTSYDIELDGKDFTDPDCVIEGSTTFLPSIRPSIRERIKKV
jgi:hypothetical protein